MLTLRSLRLWRAACLAASLALAAPAWAADCAGPPATQEASAARIGAWLQARGLKLLSFVGYSGAMYQDPAAMQAVARQVLAGHDPARTAVNIGATAAGIGAVYALARERGFTTIGIVSTLAREQGEALSPCVQQVFFVRDASWGGRLPQGGGLAPTSAAIVALSAEIVAIGGGEIAHDELRGARAAGVSVSFYAADMDHALARAKAQARGLPPPTDFGGAAREAFNTATR